MAAFPRLSPLTRYLPTLAGAGSFVAVAAAVWMLPVSRLEQLVWTSGVASLVPAAAPPLGHTARAMLAVGGGVVAGAVVWASLFLLFGPGGWFGPQAADAVASPKPERQAKPKRRQLRRADAHPDAPPRRPMSAADLGTPLMEVAPTPPAEQALPTELDQPLAAFDPAAIPAVPRVPQRALPPLAPGERLDTFALVPPPPPVTAPARPKRREPTGGQSIDTLLRRLEEGARRQRA